MSGSQRTAASISNKRNFSYYLGLSYFDRLKYLKDGHVTVAKIVEQETDKNERAVYYVARIRGIAICSRKKQWKFDTPEEARQWGKKSQKRFRRIYQNLSRRLSLST